MTLEERIFELERSLDYHIKNKDDILEAIDEGWGTQKDLENNVKTIAYFKQELEWLRELKEYRGLSTYNRPCKCHDCNYEDSEYYCDDCIWNSVNKFKSKKGG